MAEGFVQVTEGDAKKLHTFERTIGANSVHDGVYVPGEHYLASYVAVPSASISAATTAAHVVQIMAGAALKVRIRRIRIMQVGLAGAAATAFFQLWRLTTAGTGGTNIPRQAFESSDPAPGATAQSLPTAKGTESVLLAHMNMGVVAAEPILAGNLYEWTQRPNEKPIIIPAGTSNGLAVKIAVGIASLTVHVDIEFDESSF